MGSTGVIGFAKDSVLRSLLSWVPAFPWQQLRQPCCMLIAMTAPTAGMAVMPPAPATPPQFAGVSLVAPCFLDHSKIEANSTPDAAQSVRNSSSPY